MEIVIAPLDAADDAEVDAALTVISRVRVHDVPDFPPPCRYSFFGRIRNQASHTRRDYYLAKVAGEAVGYLHLSLPLRDNVENSEMELEVLPEYRRRGVGRTLYRYAVEVLRGAGRRRVAAMTSEALPGGPPRGDAGGRFAAAMGAKEALVEVRRRLDLSTMDETALAGMLAGAYAKAGGYRLVQWRGPVADELAADVAYLDARLVVDAPMGDLTWEPENMDTARIRESEAVRAARGIRAFSTGMVDEAGGRLVALTSLGIERSHPQHGHQWITIVDPDHRGRRLGIVVKLENLAQARREEPRLAAVDTWNADSNRHMIGINEAMGFRAVDSWVNWQAEI